MRQLAYVAIEYNLSVAENQKTHGHVAVLTTRHDAKLICLWIEFMGRHRERILQTMRDQQGTGAVDIALLHDEFHDRVRGDWVESSRRRIVQQQFWLCDDCSRNGDAPAHAP